MLARYVWSIYLSLGLAQYASYSDWLWILTVTTSSSSALEADTDYGRAPTLARLGHRLLAFRVPVCSLSQSLVLYNNLTLLGTYAPDPSDSSGINSDKIGITFVTFDSTSGTSGHATPRIFVGVANVGSDNLFMSNDAGTTCESTVLGMNMRTYEDFQLRVRHYRHEQQLDSTQGCIISERTSIVPVDL